MGLVCIACIIDVPCWGWVLLVRRYPAAAAVAAHCVPCDSLLDILGQRQHSSDLLYVRELFVVKSAAVGVHTWYVRTNS